MYSKIRSAAFGAATFHSSVRFMLTCGLLTVLGAPVAQADFLWSTISYPASNTQGGLTRSVFDSSLISEIGVGYTVQAQSFYGVNKVFASTGGVVQSVQATANQGVSFDLLGGVTGTPIQLLVSIGYEFSITTTGIGGANFGLFINSQTPTPYVALTTGNQFSGDICFDRPLERNVGTCAGARSGIITVGMPYSFGPNQNLSVQVQAFAISDANSSATVDAFNTARILSVIVPDGVQWRYTESQGNPLNFRNASDTAVPEPATAGLLGLGVFGVWITAARKKKSQYKQSL